MGSQFPHVGRAGSRTGRLGWEELIIQQSAGVWMRSYEFSSAPYELYDLV